MTAERPTPPIDAPTGMPTEAMIEAGATKIAEMCGHDEEPRGWDKDVARACYRAMQSAAPAVDDE